jgi:hypothetical protein
MIQKPYLSIHAGDERRLSRSRGHGIGGNGNGKTGGKEQLVSR